jgi:hypothetical protein
VLTQAAARKSSLRTKTVFLGPTISNSFNEDATYGVRRRRGDGDRRTDHHHNDEHLPDDNVNKINSVILLVLFTNKDNK